MILLFSGLFACTGETPGEEPAVPVGPEITHTQPAGVREGEAVPLAVSATDDDGVEAVTVYYRTEGTSYWEALLMDGDGDDAFSAEIPGEEVRASGLEYYFKAEDQADPSAVAYLPADNAQDPFGLVVGVVGAPLPFEEDFELAEEGGDDLYALDWISATDGFAGYPWELTAARSWDGATGVVHPRGYSGVDLLEDWLIAPALDFTTLSQIQVTWHEYGAATAGADHSLWLSTGSLDPADGEFVEVTSLTPPPEGEWGRSQLVDLSAWAGEDVVYLAWRYVGSYADDWYLDAVSVRELGADIEATFRWSPDPVDPGAAATLNFELTNTSPVDSQALVASLVLPEGSGAVDAAERDVAALASGESAALDFALTVDPAWPDNSYLPVELTVSDGVDRWDFDFQMVVGEPSEGRVSVLPASGGYLEIHVGVGDPDAPALEERIYAGTPDPGVLTAAVDLTDFYSYLPPAAGEDRWYARIVTQVDLSVEGFEIDFGEETFTASALPEVLADETAIVWLPEPPAPTLETLATFPATVAPGARGVTLDVTLLNAGAATSGPVTATLVSADGDVTVRDGGPRAVTDFPWGSGETATAGPFVIDVDPGHISSIDLQLELLLDDGVEQWTLDVDVPVPWVVIRAVGVTIDDGDDGLLDPGEAAAIEIELSNFGDLDTDGVAEATLRVAAGSPVSANLGGESENLGVMDAGDSADAEFTVTADAGASPGEALDLEVVITDDRSSYVAPLQIVLGETPWIYLSANDDATGDAFGYTFDLVNAQYRLDGETFQLRLHSAGAFDAGLAYVEMFGLGSGDSQIIRLSFQSGVATLQGWDNSLGFVTLYSPEVDYPGATQLQMSWPLAVMGLTQDYFTVGLGAGWCSVETGNFCDHFPDGWEHYYTGYYSSNFFTIRVD